MPAHLRKQIAERMKGNTFGRGGRGRRLSEETKKMVSDGLRKAWREGRIRPRQALFSPEERRQRKNTRAKEIYAENREKMRERHRQWTANNRERKKQIAQRYQERHRDRLNAEAREKNPARREYMRTYLRQHRAQNPDLYSLYTKRRRARKCGAVGQHTEAEWRERIKEAGGVCVYCGVAGSLTRDHDIPLARGGSDLISNIVPACGHCNSAKGTLTGQEFRERLASLSVAI